MKLRFPLYAKLLLLLVLNLALLGGVIIYFAQGQLRFSLDSLLAGRAGERVQAVAEVIAQELTDSPRSEWEEALLRFSVAYNLEFHVFRNDGSPALEPSVPLPPEVMQRLRDNPGVPQFPRPPGWMPLEGGPPGDGVVRPLAEGPAEPLRFREGRRPEGKRPEGARPEGERPGPPDGMNRLRPDQPLIGRLGRFGGPRAPFPKFMLRTENPRRYWVLVRMPMLERDRQRATPMSLIIESPTLGGNGLLFDFKPWLYAGATAAALSLLLWFPFARGIARSISRMRQTTAQIAEGQLEARVVSRRHDELGALAGAINGMAARLEGFVGGQKRFLGDTAHELCAPIARIQMALGILEQRADPSQKAYVEDLREEVQHMSNLVNELLSFSKASLRQREIQLEPVELAAIAQRVIDREAGDGLSVRAEIPAGLKAMAEPELLARALANLVRNALRYAGNAGPITMNAAAQDEQVTLSVADSGPGVPEETLQRIFDPFFRVEASRSRDTGGVGLGLAIVKTCVEACQGKVTAHNRKPAGLRVDITLRAASR
jgi:two-component system sensor histidine kinase CpxA